MDRAVPIEAIKPPVGSPEWLKEVFSYHAPTEGQPAKYAQLREAAGKFAEVICGTCPPCADRTAALRHVREALMTANASVALDGLV